MNLKVLFIEDNAVLSKNLKKYFNGESFSGNVLETENTESFDGGLSLIKAYDYDLVVLDLQKEGLDFDEMAGVKILEEIKKIAFIPVVFYTGHANKIQNLVSEVVGVVNKGDGFENLKEEIQRIIDSKIALLKGQVYSYLRESLRKYFWETVDEQKEIFIPRKNDVSLGYLLLRRFANSLSKEEIKRLLGDDKLNPEKAHPMEFYLFPVDPNPSIEEYQTGEILEKEGIIYTILTPDCDFVLRSNGTRKADRILLAASIPFISLPDFIKYDELRKKAIKTQKEESEGLPNLKGKLKQWMANNAGEKDRYFFLPETPFIKNTLIDFQLKTMVDYDDLRNFKRLAKLDLPIAQSMVASFIRYYNRIGFPDIDSDYMIQNL